MRIDSESIDLIEIYMHVNILNFTYVFITKLRMFFKCIYEQKVCTLHIRNSTYILLWFYDK